MRNGKSYKAAAAPARKSSPKGPWRSVNPARKAAWPQLGPETSAWRALDAAAPTDAAEPKQGMGESAAWFTSRGKMGRTPMGRWATSRPP